MTTSSIKARIGRVVAVLNSIKTSAKTMYEGVTVDCKINSTVFSDKPNSIGDINDPKEFVKHLRSSIQNTFPGVQVNVELKNSGNDEVIVTGASSEVSKQIENKTYVFIGRLSGW